MESASAEVARLGEELEGVRAADAEALEEARRSAEVSLAEARGEVESAGAEVVRLREELEGVRAADAAGARGGAEERGGVAGGGAG